MALNSHTEQSENASLPHLPMREWSGVRGDFTVMHFNMLADSLCFDGDNPSFPHVCDPKKILSWEYRRPLILEIITSQMPDFVCVVECDKFEDLHECLVKFGYDGFFRKKNASDHDDGCAIFYLQKKWKRKMFGVKKLSESESSHIALYARFASLEDDRNHVVITSMHLKAKPGYEKLRDRQILNFMGILGLWDFECPHIICGDFNDVPDSLCVQSTLRGTGSNGKLAFEDAYGQFEGHYTTYKKRDKVVKRTIDYIFYQPHPSIEMTGALLVPNPGRFPEMLPARDYPSDHLALCVGFSFKKVD